MHHVVINVIVVIIAMLTFSVTCYTTSPFYHASLLTIQNSLTPRALWLPQACHYGAMIEENRQLVTDEPVEFKK